MMAEKGFSKSSEVCASLPDHDGSDECTLKCPLHVGEVIKYYCPRHSFLGCNTCININHPACKHSLYIPDVAKSMTSELEIKETVKYQEKLEKMACDIASDARNKIDETEKKASDAVKKLRAYRKEINDALDEAENELLEKTEEIKSELVSKWKKINDQGIKTMREVVEMSKRMKTLKKENKLCNLFTEVRQSKSTIAVIERTLTRIDYRNEKMEDEFLEININCIAFLLREHALGAILKIKLDITDNCVDINVKTKTDKVSGLVDRLTVSSNTCWISSSLVLNNNNVLIADRTNNKLKVIDTTQDIVKDELDIKYIPCDVTKIDNSEIPSLVAVSLTDESKVVFVSYEQQLKTERIIDVEGECRGLAYCDNYLFSTLTNPDRVVMMNLQGLIIRTVLTNGDEGKQLNDPRHIAVNPLKNLLYISNYGAGTVLCVDFDGNILNKFTDHKLKRPSGITVDSKGMVYVCDERAHTVFQLTKDCKKCRFLLTKGNHGIKYPYTISYDEYRDVIYIGMRYTDQIKVFGAKTTTFQPYDFKRFINRFIMDNFDDF